MSIRIDPDGKHFYVLAGTLPGNERTPPGAG